MVTLDLSLATDGREVDLRVSISDLVIAGWTGADAASVEHHIRELEKLGVQRPKRTPMFYRVSASLLTTSQKVDVVGMDSSGEVEFVLMSSDAGLLVGLGSDHTDRKVEAHGVTLSKQVCPKPIGRSVWRFSEVEGHWDELVLQSFLVAGSGRTLYQEGSVASIKAPSDLMSAYLGSPDELPSRMAMFCGTLPVRGEVRAAEAMALGLWDPVLKRRLTHEYAMRVLPNEG